MSLIVEAQCPKCGAKLQVEAPVANTPTPATRSKLTPVGNILVYKISSKTIDLFIREKAKMYVPDVKVEIVPRYCESKKKNEYAPKKSYASLRIAFSENIVEKASDLGWYGKIGESADSVNIIPSMFHNIIEAYSYRPSDIDAWLDSYKNLENLEERHGMTEAYISDLKNFARPRRFKTATGDSWIVFAAAPENVIRDMLTDPTTGKVPGRIEISNPYEIQKGGEVEYIVYLHPGEIAYSDNPHVRAMLLGEEKPKK